MNGKTDTKIFMMLKDPAMRDKGFLRLMDTHKVPVYLKRG